MLIARLIASVLLILLAPSIGLAGQGGAQVASAAAPDAAPAHESWQKEFNDVCSKTQDAMTFSVQDLAALIQRCDALQARMDKLGETQKKVYMGRLRMCRGLYAYVLDSKKDEKK